MNIWMVILIAGRIVETIGPLPYDMNECEYRRDEKLAEVTSIFDHNGGSITAGDHTVRKEQLQMKCVRSVTRPVLDHQLEVTP